MSVVRLQESLKLQKDNGLYFVGRSSGRWEKVCVLVIFWFTSFHGLLRLPYCLDDGWLPPLCFPETNGHVRWATGIAGGPGKPLLFDDNDLPIVTLWNIASRRAEDLIVIF